MPVRLEGAVAVADLDPFDAGMVHLPDVALGIAEVEVEAVAIAAVAQGHVDVVDRHGWTPCLR
jgi:hypothetical protein